MSGAFGDIRVCPQEAGPDVGLRIFGDEFYARYETPSGFTCLYDEALGQYCYAELADGAFVSSAVPVDQPPPVGLAPRLKERPYQRNERFDARFAEMQSLPPPSDVGLEVYGPNKGLLSGRQLSRGKIRGLAIMVDFKDVETTITPDEVRAMLNGENYKANGNYCSVREYFLLMSGGKLDFTNEVVGPLKLRHKRSHYVNNLLAAEALNLAVAQGVDLSKFDSRRQGVIDALSFLYAGPTVWEKQLWPHNSSVGWRGAGYSAGMYQISALGAGANELVVGTYCHEAGHMLCRFPDLYDYGKADGDFEASAGLGVYCLMSAGNHLNAGRTPAPVCGYLRDLAGWCDERVSLAYPSAYVARHGAYDTIHVYETRNANEYFIIENRSRLGLDAHAPSEGLAVYHCDIKGSNERQAGTGEMHYQCSLLQADRRLDLEQNQNQGDGGDFFALAQGETLSGTTTPALKLWDGSDSGLRLADISAPGEMMSFAVLARRDTLVDEPESADTNTGPGGGDGGGPGGNTNGKTDGGAGDGGKTDAALLKRLLEQKEVLQTNLDLIKLTNQAEQEKLKAELDRIKAGSDRQKAELDQLKQLFPGGVSKPQVGETKYDDKFGYIAQLAVQHAVSAAGHAIASAVVLAVKAARSAAGQDENSPAVRIALVDSLDLCADEMATLQITGQLETFCGELTDQVAANKAVLDRRARDHAGEGEALESLMLAAGIGKALTIAPNILSSLADIAGYFQAQDTYKTVTVTAPTSALQVSVVEGLRAQASDFAGAACFPDFRALSSVDKSPLLKNYKACLAARRTVKAGMGELSLLIAGTQKDLVPAAQAAHARSDSLVKAWDEFDKVVTSVTAGKAHSPLVAAAVREYLWGPEAADVYPLYVAVTTTGGELSDRKWLWRRPPLVFLGGCTASYALGDRAGKLLAAGTVRRLSSVRYKRGQSDALKFDQLELQPAGVTFPVAPVGGQEATLRQQLALRLGLGASSVSQVPIESKTHQGE